MASQKLKENIYWVGARDPELRIFDIIMSTKRGTTYNSYVINDEKVAVVDTVKDKFYDEFKENLVEVIGSKKVDYIIVHHTELDHSGSIKRLLEDYPEAKIVGSKAAIMYLKNILNRPFESIEAKEALNLGRLNLEFIMAPNLHWPDTIFTYIKEEKILFTCDFTGCHYCPDGPSINGELANDYDEEMKYYFDVIMGPFKKFVNMALDKIENLDFDMIAPSHGPVHASTIDKYLGLYREWSKEEVADEKYVAIFYISAYGNTEKVANHMKDYIESKNIKANVYEITSMDLNEAVSILEKSAGFMIGSPTINQDAVKPAWDLLSLVSAIVNKGKPAAAFGSYGWSGEGVDMLTARMKSLKLKTLEPGFKFAFVPSEDDLKRATEFLDKFLEMLTK